MPDAHRPFRIRVETTFGADGALLPRRFFLGARRIEVTEILDQWPGDDYVYFKVRGDDGDRYILRHAHSEAAWELSAYQRGGD